MAEQRYEIMVLIQNPPEYLSWPRPEKLAFYENVVRWHDYIQKLMKAGDVTRAWGAEKLPGRVRFVGTKILLIAIYKTTFGRFSELLTQDPLWDSAWYEAPILKSIAGDYEDDLKRYQRQRSFLEEKLSRKLPKPVVDYQWETPRIKSGGRMEVLVLSKNSPGYQDLSDEEKLMESEKILQMHNYHRPLRESGVIAEEWGTYQNCGFGVWAGGNVAEGVHITRVNSYDEFDAVFLSDPVRNISRVHTIVLVPFEESRRRAQADLKVARTRLKAARSR
jgi:hypothetical protein